MTEFESMQLLDNALANFIAQGDSLNSAVALFYTVLFGYVVAAYVAGAALTKVQVFIGKEKQLIAQFAGNHALDIAGLVSAETP